MNKTKRFYAVTLLAIMSLLVGSSLAQKPSDKNSPQPQAASNPVTGSGSAGQISKWTGISGSNTFVLGDSVITEDKFGKVGIGTVLPSSKLSVAGTIESLSGGFKFPDGSVQTTAGLSSLFRDATLSGNGTAGSPLGIATGGVGTLQLGNGAVTGQKIANGSVVRSLNGLFDNVQLTAGSNITITPNGNTLTIAAIGEGLFTVAHDLSLTGDGTGSSPLRVAVPLNLRGTLPRFNSIIDVQNFGDGNGIAVRAGDSQTEAGGDGITASGGFSGNVNGGVGVVAIGGSSSSGPGGHGGFLTGGDSEIAKGGIGVAVRGGFSLAGGGGVGVFSTGGSGLPGGTGIVAQRGPGATEGTDGLAGDFLGDVLIVGALNVTGSKNFKIDHPLDPANKYLYHAAVESSEVLNVYSGNTVTDGNGEAAITLPEWFEAINSDLRYQLTVVGTFAQAIVADEVRNNQFTIKTTAPNVKVSWQVTGVRSDSVMKKHPFKVVEAKSEQERGHYLMPEAVSQPEEKSIQWARYPEQMKQVKERNEQLRLKQQSPNR